ncbi:MAG: VOC family protein [Myxococcota bacterium]|nr:VOC family protein [Myxococcota bacterium]
MSDPLVWFEALGQHGDRLQGFYREVLGWEFDPEGAGPSRPAGARPTRSRRAGRGGRAAAPPRPPWWVTFYSPVADLDAAIARARALGSRLLVKPTRHGEVTIAVISDPEGHPVGLCS